MPEGSTGQEVHVNRAAVLGAGIMGGGIAFASAASGVPVVLKDIAQAPLDQGMAEVAKLLRKRLDAGQIDPARAEQIGRSIVPSTTYESFDEVDLVVEAIVENVAVKKAVLREVEERIGEQAILVSNTSSLSIAEIGTALQRPHQFAGMHFFNPVPVMPLVEVVRGPHTSAQTAEAVAAYARRMGKVPVIVRDCPGFLVNRILTAYFVGFLLLLRDGADFEIVDKVMEQFGWPMGPAALQDVIGLDTSSHVVRLITSGYPQRMRLDFVHAIEHLARVGRHGQKSGGGFYAYSAGPRGRPQKASDPLVRHQIACLGAPAREFDGETIVERMMLPMIVEAATCLEDGVVGSAENLDTSLLLGVGFPRQRGGVLRYADQLGLGRIVERCGPYTALGGAYRPTAAMLEMASAGR